MQAYTIAHAAWKFGVSHLWQGGLIKSSQLSMPALWVATAHSGGYGSSLGLVSSSAVILCCQPGKPLLGKTKPHHYTLLLD